MSPSLDAKLNRSNPVATGVFTLGGSRLTHTGGGNETLLDSTGTLRVRTAPSNVTNLTLTGGGDLTVRGRIFSQTITDIQAALSAPSQADTELAARVTVIEERTSSVDNSRDVDKPISTLTAQALSGKLNAANPVATGVLTVPQIVSPTITAIQTDVAALQSTSGTVAAACESFYTNTVTSAVFTSASSEVNPPVTQTALTITVVARYSR
jgi:hypothetical protein